MTMSDDDFDALVAAQRSRPALAARILDLELRQKHAADPDVRAILARRAADARADLAAANAVVKTLTGSGRRHD